MTKAKFFVAAALLATATLAPGLADARHNRHHLHNWGLPYPISYLHNYGPGLQPSPTTTVPPPSSAARARLPISARTAGGIPVTDIPLLALPGQV